ncbi:MAG: porin [Alphaproteobacteria bacterium]|nr:porin [Alphaproteobacteria bacterium]
MRANLQAWSNRLNGTAIVALLAASAPGTALAQSADRIDAIEQHIRQLEGELQHLKGELNVTRQQLRQSQRATAQARATAQQATRTASETEERVAAAPQPALAPAPLTPAPQPPAPGPKVVQTAGNRFGLESADGRNSIYLTGRLHLDTGGYLDYHADSKYASVTDLNSGFNARRARLGVTGKFAGDWNYTLIYDFGGASDGLPPTTGAPVSGIESAFITYNGINKGAFPIAFDLGYMDTPFTLEEATSSNDILFMERASIQAVASNIFANDFRSAAGVRSNDDRYWAGVYLTGPASGASHTTGEQYGAFGRATYQVLQTPEYSLHLGGDVGALLKPPGAPRTITLSDRPELRIDPTAILSTGPLGTATNPVNGAQVYGVEAAAGWRNLFMQGEYYRIDLDRQGLSSVGFDGGYVEGSWTVSGEQRKYNPATGAYLGIVPDHPFEPWADNYGTGAWELVARYSTVDLNHGAPSAVGAVGGGQQTVYTVGMNWYPNTNMRLMVDFLHGDIKKRFISAASNDTGIAGTPVGASVGGNFDALAMRAQFAF